MLHGTYLKGKIFIGEFSQESGPDGVAAANKLSDCLKKIGITFGIVSLGMIIYKKFFHKNNQTTLDNKEKNNII